jgi:integrase
MEKLRHGTVRQYSMIAGRLLTLFSADTGISWKEDPSRVADWFSGKTADSDWGRRTFWLYRAALTWFMQNNGPANATLAIKNIKASLPLNGTETSSKKMKAMPEIMTKKLFRRLETSVNPLDLIILRWLKAGRYAGLRPGEWEHASMPATTLTVRNAKKSELRANGESRNLVFRFPEQAQEINAIKDFLNDVREWTRKKPFAKFYERCRHRITYICRDMYSDLVTEDGFKAITLYSPRHQFAADMKASGLTKKQIAALMGHASEDSATIHYARARAGSKRLPPASPDSEVKTVRQPSNNFFRQREIHV